MDFRNEDEFEFTKGDVKQLEEAFKKDKFRELLNDYFEEVNDPKNKELYEKEFIEFEKERGVDVTFIHPEPGYVIKSSIGGEKKAFINICTNNNVGKPSITSGNGQPGLSWSLPFFQSPPREDTDKKYQFCTVFDVLFHPEALVLANQNDRFRELVNDTALSAVEDSFKVKLDRKNLVFPKIKYKGAKVPTIVRKPRENYEFKEKDKEDLLANCPYPYSPPPKESIPLTVKPRGNYEENDTPYTCPKYILKQRKNVDIQDFTDAADAKFHGAIPSELVVEIELPLIRSAGDVNLDVVGKSLSLISEQPAKYKLNISLPYNVDDEKGNAKFDKTKKKLIVVLPVKRSKFNYPEIVREDSGIESDPNQYNCSSSEEDIRKNVKEFPMNNTLISEVCQEPKENHNKELWISQEVKTQFLNKDFHYSFPENSLILNESSITVNMEVKNIDPQSVAHQFICSNEGVHIKFASLGAGYFPVYYAFCLKIPGFTFDTSSLKVDVWDNSLIASLKLKNSLNRQILAYFVGTSLDSLQEKKTELKQVSNEENETHNDLKTEKQNDSKDSSALAINDNSSRKIENQEETTDKDSETDNKIVKQQTTSTAIVPNKFGATPIFKTRTFSESNEISDSLATGKRSILKCSRSLSESHTDDYTTWSSLDSESHEDLVSSKKTVRFSDVVSRKIFRANSSILGQRKKNEKKSRNKKKAANARMLAASSGGSEESETEREECDSSSISEMSDVSSDDNSSGGTSKSAITVIPSSKRHRRRGAKNQRKAAATAKLSHFVD